MTRTMGACALAAVGAIVLANAPIAAQGTTSKPAASSAKAAATPAATMTGCLHADGSKYMLTNVEGANAPKARNWKTAYVTKSTKNVEVVGASSSLKLKDQVGHKVTVSGTRDGDTHFKAQSLKQVAKSCS